MKHSIATNHGSDQRATDALNERISRAESLLARGCLEHAIVELEGLERDQPANAPILFLLKQARERLAAERLRVQTDALIAKARDHVAAGAFGEARQCVAQALELDSSCNAAQTLRTTIAAEEAEQKRRAIASGLEELQRLIAAERLDEANALAQSLSSEYPEDAAIAAARQSLRAAGLHRYERSKREARIRELEKSREDQRRLELQLKAATELLNKFEYEQAVQLLESLKLEYRDSQAVDGLLRHALDLSNGAKTAQHAAIPTPHHGPDHKRAPEARPAYGARPELPYDALLWPDRTNTRKPQIAVGFVVLSILLTVLYFRHTAQITVSPSSLKFEYNVGDTLLPLEKVLRVTGGEPDQIHSTADWLSVDRIDDRFIVKADPGTLSSGKKVGQIEISGVRPFWARDRSQRRVVNVELEVLARARALEAVAPSPSDEPPATEFDRIAPKESTTLKSPRERLREPAHPRPVEPAAVDNSDSRIRDAKTTDSNVVKTVPNTNSADCPDTGRYSGGDTRGSFTWNGAPDAARNVSIRFRQAVPGQLSGSTLPKRRVSLTAVPGVKVLQTPTSCNDWKLEFENPGLARIDFEWHVLD